MKFKNKKSLSFSGFTLIELMLVIAILAILSSIVVSSTISARDKSRDARVKQTVSDAALYAGRYPLEVGDNSYTGLCDDTELNTLLDSAFEAARYTRDSGISDCISDANRFIMAVPLRHQAGQVFCADYTGAKKQFTKTLPVVLTGSGTCDDYQAS